MKRTISFDAAGIYFSAEVNYKPPRPAPQLDPKRYDDTLCDTGDEMILEVLDVKAGGKEISCDKDKFLSFFMENILEELED